MFYIKAIYSFILSIREGNNKSQLKRDELEIMYCSCLFQGDFMFTSGWKEIKEDKCTTIFILFYQTLLCITLILEQMVGYYFIFRGMMFTGFSFEIIWL